MKAFWKQLLALTLFLSLALLTFAACAEPPDNGDGGGGNPVTVKQVIDDSVVKMEDMFAQEAAPLSAAQPLALVLPNQSVFYEHERSSMIGGSCFSMYVAKHISGLADFEPGTTYKDAVEEAGLEFLFRAEKVENGIAASMEMHQVVDTETRISKIQLHFHYDYENETALDTTIISFETSGISLAKLDYQTGEALAYEFDVAAADYEGVKEALRQKTFDFDKFTEQDIVRYKLAKMQVKLETVQAYSYIAGEDEQPSSINAEQLEAFYNDVYAKVKDECIEKEYLNKETATSKEYYIAMYTYASEQARNLMTAQ